MERDMADEQFQAEQRERAHARNGARQFDSLNTRDYDDIMKAALVISDPDILGGTPVFAGTRVPVQALVDHLEAGETIDDFLEGFPTVGRRQVTDFLKQAKEKVCRSVENSA